MNILNVNAPVAENIERIIKEKGFKQCAIARKIGYSPQELCDMVNGRRIIKVNDIPKFCLALDIDVNDLFYEKAKAV